MNLLSCWTCGDRSDVSDAEIRAQTSLLADRVDRLDDLVTLTAKYTQIGQGDEPDTAVHLDDLVDDLIGTIGVPPQVSIRVEGRLPVVRVRRTAIADILSCLLDNALRQIGPAEGVVRIGCDSEGSSGG